MKTETDKDKEFLAQVNSCLGIIKSASRIYSKTREEQEDIFQEIMLQLWKSYDSFAGQSRFSTWVYRVALNTALTHNGKTKKIRKMEVASSSPMTQVSEETTYKDHHGILMSAMQELNRVDRAILFLYLEQKTYDEIGEITGISPSNVGVKLNRIRQKLRDIVAVVETKKELENGIG